MSITLTLIEVLGVGMVLSLALFASFCAGVFIGMKPDPEAWKENKSKKY